MELRKVMEVENFLGKYEIYGIPTDLEETNFGELIVYDLTSNEISWIIRYTIAAHLYLWDVIRVNSKMSMDMMYEVSHGALEYIRTKSYLFTELTGIEL